MKLIPLKNENKHIKIQTKQKLLISLIKRIVRTYRRGTWSSMNFKNLALIVIGYVASLFYKLKKKKKHWCLQTQTALKNTVQ